jgi:hypothetical protein
MVPGLAERDPNEPPAVNGRLKNPVFSQGGFTHGGQTGWLDSGA